jgi:hypothetical protein
MSKIAALIILAIAITIAVPLDFFYGRWTLLLIRTWEEPDRMWTSYLVQDGTGVLLALAWSLTAFLGWRAVRATFAANRLRTGRGLASAFD